MFGKNLKRLLALLLALVMVFALCACDTVNNNDDDDDDEGGSSVVNPDKGGDLDHLDPDNMTPKDLMMAVEQDSIQGAVGVLTQVLKAMESGEVSMDAFGAEMDLEIRLGATGLALLQSVVPSEVIDLTGLQKIGLDSIVKMDGDLTQTLVTLSVNGKKLADLDMIADMATMTIWFGLPGLADKYLQMDAETLGSVGNAEEALPDNSIDEFESWSTSEQAGMAVAPVAILEMLPKVLPDADKLEAVLERYIEVVLKNITNVTKENTTLEIDGAKQEGIVLTYTITEKDIAKIILEVMKTAKNDGDLKDIVDELAKDLDTVAKEQGASFTTDLWASLESFLNNGIEYFGPIAEGQVVAENSGNKIVITTTLDNKNNVIGRSFAMYTNNQPDIEFSYLAVTEGALTNFNLLALEYGQSMSHGFAILGHQTKVGNVITEGAYEIHAIEDETGMKLLTVELANLTETSGTIIITPQDDLYRAIFGATLDVEFALKLQLQGETLTTEVLADGEMVIGIDMTAKQVNGASIQKPTNIYDAAEGNLASWLTEDVLNKLIENWNATGMAPIRIG